MLVNEDAAWRATKASGYGKDLSMYALEDYTVALPRDGLSYGSRARGVNRTRQPPRPFDGRGDIGRRQAGVIAQRAGWATSCGAMRDFGSWSCLKTT